VIDAKKKDPTGIISRIYHKTSLALIYLGFDNESKNTETAIKFAQTIENENIKNFRQPKVIWISTLIIRSAII
jgi:hypothetical protein